MMSLEHAQQLVDDLLSNLIGNYDEERRHEATQAQLLLDLIEEVRGLRNDLKKE